MPLKLIASPLNYTGGKSKLLPQLIPLFPDNITTFVDIFCGGCNVAINVQARNYICNDLESHLIGLLNKIKNDGKDKFSEHIDLIINKHLLSDTTKHDYGYYNCTSSDGLGKYNRDKFLAMRSEFNLLKSNDDIYYYLFFTLIVYAFNNQIRFNSDGQYNLPVGKRDFNKKIREKLNNFATSIVNKDISFMNQSFEQIDMYSLPDNSFIYADPPYLITTATYNERNGWSDENEIALLKYLDKLSLRGINFALSNVLESNGKKNYLLEEWLTKTNYNCHKINANYHNSNYHKKQKGYTNEVLITNY